MGYSRFYLDDKKNGLINEELRILLKIRTIKKMKASLVLSLLLIMFSCKDTHSDKQHRQKTDSLAEKMKIDSNGMFRLLRSGIPQEVKYENALNVIGKKWGIAYYWVAGCIVSDKLSDSIEKNNSEVLKRIELKFGKDWYVKFNQEIEQQIIQDSLMKNER